MSASKPPRKKYRPRPVLMTPIGWGSQRAMLTTLGLRTRQAVDAMLSSAPTPESLEAVEAECIAAIYLHRAGTQLPDQHEVDPQSLASMGPALTECANAISNIRERYRRIGRIGVSGPERTAMASLADCLDALREAMPRRMWQAAYLQAIEHPVLRMPRKQLEAV